METQETIAPAPVAESPKPQALAAPLPWAQDRSAPVARLERPVETVHWSVVALTVLTAASVLFGSYGRTASAPRELLPVMIVASAR